MQPCTIEQFGEIVSGATPSTENASFFCNDGIHWLSPKDLTSTKKKFIFRGETDITDAGYKSCSTRLMPKGTVLLTSRAPVGTVAIAMDDLCTNQGFKSIIPNSEFGTAFVYYFLKENKSLLESHSSGTTFMEISGNVLKSIPAFIPDCKALTKFNTVCNTLFPMQLQIEKEIDNLDNLKYIIAGQISSR